MISLPKIFERTEQDYFAIREAVVMPFGDVIDRVMPELDRWIAEKGVQPAGAPFFKYNVVKMPELEVEFGFPVAEPVAADGRVLSGVLPAGRYVSMTYFGHYDDLEEVTAVLMGWATKKGLNWDSRPGPDGDIFSSRLEIYHNDPMAEPDSGKWETELLFKLAD